MQDREHALSGVKPSDVTTVLQVDARDAAQAEKQVMVRAEASRKRVFQDGTVWRGHLPLQQGHPRAGEVWYEYVNEAEVSTVLTFCTYVTIRSQNIPT